MYLSYSHRFIRNHFYSDSEILATQQLKKDLTVHEKQMELMQVLVVVAIFLSYPSLTVIRAP